MRNLVIIVAIIVAAIAGYYFIGFYYLDIDSTANNFSDEMIDEENTDNNSASNTISFQSPDEAELTSSAWSWQYTELQTGERIDAPAGDSFVLSFGADGRVTSTTDCNNLSGIASIDGEVLSMGQFVSTLMYCEGSMEQEYAKHLGLVNSYTIEGNQLNLNMNRDYGLMVFSKYNE